VDIERLERVDRAFAESISTPEERAALDAEIADDDVSAWAIASWSGKEALAKALGDAIDYDPRRLGSPMRWPGLRCGPWHAAALSAPAGHTAWLVWTTPRGAPHDPP
jgi:phosphopantetheinyl transferase